MKPVSVIIPTYNRDQYVLRAISSVIGQKEFSGEIIVVDDGSTDDTSRSIDTLQTDANLKYIRTANHGPASARNRGVEEAKHKYIAFLDSDDQWAPNKLTYQMLALEDNPGYAISHTAEQWFRRGKHLNQKKIHTPRHGNIFNHCLKLCAVGMSTVIMEKRLFAEHGGFDPDMPCCEDYDLWLRISSREPFLLVNRKLTIKDGGRSDQLSSIYRVGMDKYRIYALEKLLKTYILCDSQKSSALAELGRKCSVYGNGCLKHGRSEEGRRYLAIPEQFKIDS